MKNQKTEGGGKTFIKIFQGKMNRNLDNPEPCFSGVFGFCKKDELAFLVKIKKTLLMEKNFAISNS